MSSVHLASPPEVPEVDAEVVPKPKSIQKSRPQAPAYGIHGPLVLGFAFSFEELHKRAFERLPEYRELSQQSPQPDHKMMIRAHNFIYRLCADIDHLWPQAFKGWVRDPDTGNGMYVVGLSSNRDSDRLRMPTPAHAEKMQKILKCGEAQWYPDLIPRSKTHYVNAQVVPKPQPIRKSQPKAPAHETHGPLVLGFAFSFEELHKRAFERLPEYRELSQQSPQPDHKMMIRAHNFIYRLCADIDHLWPQAFKGWVRDPDARSGMYVVGLSSNRDSDRLRMPTPAHAEKMQKILKCGQAQWYPDLIPPSKTNSCASRF